jgi:predicted S18 family serine protease
MLDPYTSDKIKNVIKKQVEDTRQHICYGVDSIENLQYARGRLSALEALLQDIKNLQKEDNDGNTD